MITTTINFIVCHKLFYFFVICFYLLIIHCYFILDIDGNGFWDEDELKALFVRELDKFYQEGMQKADLMEKAEEMERMREHVFNEVDLNRDRLISWEEFKRMSEQPDFEKDEGWKTLDQNEIYTSEELKQFEHQRQQQIDQMIQNGHVSIYFVKI